MQELATRIGDQLDPFADLLDRVRIPINGMTDENWDAFAAMVARGRRILDGNNREEEKKSEK